MNGIFLMIPRFENSRFNRPVFWRGFRAGMPLWFAAAPIAIAYVTETKDAGFNAWEIQFMSLLIYAAATQIVVAQAVADQVPVLLLLTTVITINIQHMFYGIVLKKHLLLDRTQVVGVAFPMTDFAYGMTMLHPRNMNFAFLLGVEISVYFAWNFYTGLAVLLSPVFYFISALQLDFMVPLTFWCLLLLALRDRYYLGVAVFSVGLSVLGYGLGFGNLVIPIVGVLGPLLGIGLVRLCRTEVKG